MCSPKYSNGVWTLSISIVSCFILCSSCHSAIHRHTRFTYPLIPPCLAHIFFSRKSVHWIRSFQTCDISLRRGKLQIGIGNQFDIITKTIHTQTHPREVKYTLRFVCGKYCWNSRMLLTTYANYESRMHTCRCKWRAISVNNTSYVKRSTGGNRKFFCFSFPFCFSFVTQSTRHRHRIGTYGTVGHVCVCVRHCAEPHITHMQENRYGKSRVFMQFFALGAYVHTVHNAHPATASTISDRVYNVLRMVPVQFVCGFVFAGLFGTLLLVDNRRLLFNMHEKYKEVIYVHEYLLPLCVVCAVSFWVSAFFLFFVGQFGCWKSKAHRMFSVVL